MLRQLMPDRELLENCVDASIEICVDAPLETCIAHDPKGLYAKAQAGLIPNFTCISSPYEAPEKPEIHLNTSAACQGYCLLKYCPDRAACFGSCPGTAGCATSGSAKGHSRDCPARPQA